MSLQKNDLENGDKIADIYRHAGFEVFLCSKMILHKPKNSKAICPARFQPLSVTAVSASPHCSISFFPSLSLETGQTSKKLGRGRHTTRVVELFELDGCFVADTPGFSTVDLQRYEMIDKSRLQYCFPEFEKYLGDCMFTSCSHTCEKGCRILEALSNGEIEETRHRSYVQMYNEVKDIKSWQIKE